MTRPGRRAVVGSHRHIGDSVDSAHHPRVRRRRTGVGRSALGAVMILVGCASTAPPRVDAGWGTVVRHVDGDTLDVELGGTVERVRLIGIDTPESVIPGVEPECFGPEASQRLAGLAPAGTPVRIERDIEARDPYGRLLGYLYVEDVMVNLVLVTEGYARVLRIAPNTAFAPEFAAAQRDARRDRLAMWGACSQ